MKCDGIYVGVVDKYQQPPSIVPQDPYVFTTSEGKVIVISSDEIELIVKHYLGG
jgi:hypothetical protein